MRLVLWLVCMMVGVGGSASAQTVYVPQSQQGSAAAPQPLNLRALMRRDQENIRSNPAPIPYINRNSLGGSGDFQQRQSLLSQWRAQRDAAAHAEQAATYDYMVALSEAPDPTAFAAGVGGTQPITAAPPPSGVPAGTPMIYRGKDNDSIQKPRRLFNSVQ